MKNVPNIFIKNKTKGFTLMELMVVITLIGIIASMIGPGFLDFYERKNIKDSIQTLKTTFSKGFSSARSNNLVFGVKGLKNKQEITFFECDFPNCTNQKNFKTESLESKVSINSDNFEIHFSPPHGNISYFAENNVENTTDEFFEVTLKNKYFKKIKIYKKSGLIEALQ